MQIIRKTKVVRWAPSCRTLRRARDIPAQGATCYPEKLRSRQRPLGLPKLSKTWRKRVRTAVEEENVLAQFALRECATGADEGRSFSLVNPWDSYLWDFAEAKDLLLPL